MGRYDYLCSECQYVFEARHSAKVVINDCPKCEKKGSLSKIMNKPRINNTLYKPTKAGSVVKKTIEEMKKDIADQKKKLMNREKK